MTKTPPSPALSGTSPEVVELTAAAAPHLPAVTARLARQMAESTPDERVADEQTTLLIENLPREAGWVLVTAGVVGLIVPGIMGAPFLLAGAVVLTPGGSRRLSRWVGTNHPNWSIRRCGRSSDFSTTSSAVTLAAPAPPADAAASSAEAASGSNARGCCR